VFTGAAASIAVDEGQRAHALLDAVRESAIECNDGIQLAVHAVFGVDGQLTVTHDLGNTVERRACFASAFGDVVMTPPPTYPTTVQHHLRRRAWTGWAPASSSGSERTAETEERAGSPTDPPTETEEPVVAPRGQVTEDDQTAGDGLIAPPTPAAGGES
jgi:hypothetical protein